MVSENVVPILDDLENEENTKKQEKTKNSLGAFANLCYTHTDTIFDEVQNCAKMFLF